MKDQVVEALWFEVGERVLTRALATRLCWPLACGIRYPALALFYCAAKYGGHSGVSENKINVLRTPGSRKGRLDGVAKDSVY